MLLHTPPPSAIVGKWLWNSVHYLWDSECVFKMWYMDMQVFGHWRPLRKRLWNSLQHSWASEHVSSHEAHGQAGVCYPRPFESNCVISFLKNCMNNSGIWLPTLLYLVFCSCSSSPLLRRSFGATRGFRPTWIWVHVRRCGDNLGSGMLDWHLHCLFESFFRFSDDHFQHEMITLLSDNATYHAVVGWNVCKSWCGMNYHTSSVRALPVCAVLNPCWWALFGHRFVNKLTLTLSSWRTHFHKKLVQVFLASWFSCKLEEMGKGETGGLGWTWSSRVDLYKSLRVPFWSLVNVESYSLSSDIR